MPGKNADAGEGRRGTGQGNRHEVRRWEGQGVWSNYRGQVLGMHWDGQLWFLSSCPGLSWVLFISGSQGVLLPLAC